MLVLQYSKCHNKFEIKCNMTLLQRAGVYIVPMHNMINGDMGQPLQSC